MRESNYLFAKYDWQTVQDNQKKQLRDDVAKMDGNRLLNTSTDDLCDYFQEKFSVKVPTLDENGIVADQKEIQVYVNRAGTEIEITVPFDGEA